MTIKEIKKMDDSTLVTEFATLIVVMSRYYHIPMYCIYDYDKYTDELTARGFMTKEKADEIKRKLLQ